MSREHAGAAIVLPDALTSAHANRIAELAAKNRLPTIFGVRLPVDAGGLMVYGASLGDRYRRAAVYIDKILKGAKPGDLPVAANEVRAGDQSQDGEGPGAHDPTILAGASRPGDRSVEAG
jgi:hypothetical protein